MANFIQKVISFFNRKEKGQLIGILSGTVVMGFVEMLSVAAIMPFIAIAVNPGIIETSRHLNAIYCFMNLGSPNRFLLFVGALVFCLLVLGNGFSACMSWILMRFSYTKGQQLSTRLLNKYLSQPYPYFLNQNSNELSKNILVEVDRFVIGILTNGIQAFSKIVMILAIFVLLVAVEPYLALCVMCVFGSAYLILYRLIRKKLARAGKISSRVNGDRYQIINEALGSIKELKVLGREHSFITQYHDSALKYAQAESLNQLSPLIAKYTIEAVAFGSMLLIALYLIASHEGITKFMPLLALYALSGYRLMPAMQQLFSGYTLFKYHQSALDILFQEMQLSEHPTQTKSDAFTFKQQLELKSIRYHYPNSEDYALNHIDMHIPIHTSVGIVGASGAGKTTLIDIILGLLQPQGEMIVDGHVIQPSDLRAWQKNIGYVPQAIFLLDSSIASNIALGVPQDKINYDEVIRAAKLANLHEFVISQLPQGYETPIGERGVRLSGGQRQRIGIARALYHDPELLIFDEATSALDGITEKVIMEAIHNLGKRKTIILIAHRLNTVKECDVIYVLNQGEVAGQGTFSELVQKNKIFQHLANAYASA